VIKACYKRRPTNRMVSVQLQLWLQCTSAHSVFVRNCYAQQLNVGAGEPRPSPLITIMTAVYRHDQCGLI